MTKFGPRNIPRRASTTSVEPMAKFLASTLVAVACRPCCRARAARSSTSSEVMISAEGHGSDTAALRVSGPARLIGRSASAVEVDGKRTSGAQARSGRPPDSPVEQPTRRRERGFGPDSLPWHVELPFLQPNVGENDQCDAHQPHGWTGYKQPDCAHSQAHGWDERVNGKRRPK